ncbi:MAG: amino acid ABC transporter substrate-binding protein [Lachnospiraceae bacterium]|jgi:polar amino acid transport system substrate-binding protein|nr:amino acid ABC transporter substrate-binding protein [Lachnospiraceae bacterium]MCI9100073.1 amino acid ABC transporter substrate-binding protein [Lachnospiraceae bacterium]MCI9357903.1 amino acid ABC transporter substrate-binding protein [Lachnospiraceae bacterium]
MKKALALAVAGMMVFGLTACGGDSKKEAEPTTAPAETQEAEDTESTDEAADTADGERTTLTVGFDAEFPPYGYMDEDGEYVGFDLDLAAEVCKRQGWELVKQPINWDTKDMELSSGSIDCIWNGFTMNGREDEYTWSVPYVDNSQVFVVAEDSGISTKADLAGKTVGVQADSSALAALEDEESQENLDLAASFAALNQFADYNTAFMELEAGSIDALAMDIGVANYQISQREGYTILTGDNDQEYLATEQYAIGFLKGNDELKDLVESTLMQMVDDGTFMEIAEKYADYGLTDAVCLGK